MAGAPRTGFARESPTWGFAKWFAAGGIDSRDSARFDAAFRHISAIDSRNPLHSGTSVPAPRVWKVGAPRAPRVWAVGARCARALRNRCRRSARRAPPSRDLAPDLPLRSGLLCAQGALRFSRDIERCEDACGRNSAPTCIDEGLSGTHLAPHPKSTLPPGSGAGRFSRYGRGVRTCALTGAWCRNSRRSCRRFRCRTQGSARCAWA